MTSNVELLPLYAELQGHPKLEIIKHYARANVAHHTAELQAEIEALRAENASLRHHGTLLSNIAYNLAQDDRLPDGTRWSLDDARKRWDAAINHAAAQENDDA